MALIKCLECKKEVSETAKKCPNCGYDLKSKKSSLTTAAVLLIVAAYFFWFRPISSYFSANSTTDVANKINDLQLVEHHWCSMEYGLQAVCGTVLNNSSKTKRYVQVGVNLYDKNNNQIGSALDNILNLEPNSKWKFKAMVSEDNVHSYAVKDITGHD